MGWEASLELGFSTDGGATQLSHRAHRGPLYVQRPLRPEGREVCHVYLLHPPGGMVGGDRLSIDVRVGAGASALVTTPAAGKAYRTTGAPVRLAQRLEVAAGGTLEWLPQETIVYDGARAVLETRVELDPGARFVGGETLCFGLPAREAPFARGSCRQAFEVSRAGRALFVERGTFAGGGRVHGARWGLGGASVLGLLVATPAPPAEVVAAVRERAVAAPDGDAAAVTVIGEGDAAVVVCRYLGGSAERARAFQHDAWRLLRPALLGRAAVAPRIWAT